MASRQQISVVPDGPDRKRVLNVLAQRRYRQRKRERMQFLENVRLNPRPLDSNNADAMICASSSPEIIPNQLQLQQGSAQTQSLGFGESNDHSVHTHRNTLNNNSLYHPDMMVEPSNTSYICPTISSELTTWCPRLCDDDWSKPNSWEQLSTSEDSSSQSIRTQAEMNDDEVLHPFNDDTTSTSSRILTPQPSSTDPEIPISWELQDLTTSQFTFPTEKAIEIPLFKTMNVTLQIANLLGCTSDLLDLAKTRILDISKISLPNSELPKNLLPTEAQLTIPHHAVLDILPWPSVRTRLIHLFNQPDHLRPSIARGEMAIMHLTHGFEDVTEGLRITADCADGDGCSPWFDGRNWEIGQAILKDWWWALDPEIVSNSNRLRNRRGARKLYVP